MEFPRVTVTQLLRDDCEIVGYSQDGEDAIRAATTYNPDLLVRYRDAVW
jgi:hypothetical protein